MKLRNIAGLILILIALAGVQTATAYTNVNLSFSFNDVLSPYGTWISVSSCGHCWRPYSSAYVPYTNGYWAYTNYGPTWVGDEPWSWAAHHYGRWIYTAQFGWVWMPGYDWHAGRVSWAYGDDYIGWAPYGASTANVNLWIMIDRDNFYRDNYRNYVVRRDVVRNLFDRRTVRVHSGALQRTEIERITRRPVRTVSLESRQVTADSRATRLVIPKEREQVVIKQISDASRKAKEREKTTIKAQSGSSKSKASSKEHSKVSSSQKENSHGKEMKSSDKKSSTQKVKSSKSQKKKPKKPHK